MRQNLVRFAAVCALTAATWLRSGAAAQVSVPASTAVTAPAAAPLEEKQFTDSKSGISIRLPKGWVKKAGIQDTGYEAPAKDRNEIGGLAPNVVLALDATPGIKPADLPKVTEQKRKQYTQVFDSYKETRNDVVTIDGKQAAVLGGNFLIQHVLKVEWRQVWIITDGKVYTITFTSLSSTVEKNLPTFDAMIQTIRVP